MHLIHSRKNELLTWSLSLRHWKSLVSKELNDQQELLQSTIRANAILTEEIKTKDSLIRELSNNEDNQNIVSDVVDVTETFNCTLCNFTSNVANDLNIHSITHMKYSCSKGCKDTSFVTQEQLDSHIKNRHSKIRTSEFKCDNCSAKFVAEHQLRQHISKKHARISHNVQMINCKRCGQIFEHKNELDRHIKDCIDEFVDVNRKECKFFRRGNCLKGNSCRFAHTRKASVIQKQCRNGNTCVYFARGHCKFTHKNTLPQNIQSNNGSNTRQCRYKEECFQLFNCQFTHTQQDFYNFARKNSPPMWQRNHPVIPQANFRV